MVKQRPGRHNTAFHDFSRVIFHSEVLWVFQVMIAGSSPLSESKQSHRKAVFASACSMTIMLCLIYKVGGERKVGD